MTEQNVDYKKTKKRLDGRKMDETRPLKIDVGVIPNADGSAYLEWGQNKVYAAVYGPREALPKHSANAYKSVIKVEYRMTSFSVPDRKRPGPNRRDQEISKVLSEALSRAVFVEQFPNTEIGVYVEVIDSNAGSRVACLTAASCALADAGLPMRDLVAATGVGKAYGELVIDLNKDEEDAPDAVDIPIAILPNSEEIVLLQMDGLLTKKEWEKIAKLGIQGCKDVYAIQKEALQKKFKLGEASKKDLGKKTKKKVKK
ncbi:MAG: exosome complex exonuclease Rrp41 [Candidatus Diapherotrites archaeon]|jgi:exosome complex component RRP41|uniref:Exosome complex exonuclease Rrp41 n=1 Tax=Candidatus Iainarchaeum sp. TaxID=3101447 RepID=A0A8T5GDL1_9ARCH|nr:exosome complex exonuclease Rrp41 [Candidatus Diapherotrites archaeon]MBT7241708.1 exosome complex exonuclease Rrp41 [Candidatus Diapherotrites archaeon]